jgi:hypothetical protein
MLPALVLASCGSAHTGVSDPAAKASATTEPSLPSLPTSPASTSTVINHYPGSYDPGYTTVGQLVRDSTFIVTGALRHAQPGRDQSGKVVMSYPITTEKILGTVPPISLTVSRAEVAAANLRVGETYLFFWTADPAERTACIVGGVRGVLSYDAATDTVTRLDHSVGSDIPRTQSFEQLATSVDAAQTLFSHQAIRNQPPVCSPSATGIPAGS